LCKCIVDTPSSLAHRSVLDNSDSIGMFASSSVLATPSLRVSCGNMTSGKNTLVLCDSVFSRYQLLFCRSS